jgi:hypothetical protein
MSEAMPAADSVAAAMASTWKLLARGVERGWAREVGGTMAMVTGVPVAALNGVWATRESITAWDIDAALDVVAAVGLPYCLEARPGCGAARSVAERRGFAADADVPLLAFAGRIGAAPPADLALRVLAPAHAAQHAAVSAPAFGMAYELMAALVTPAILALPQVRCYLGEVGGEPVVTAMSVRLGDAVGLFNVATPIAHRGRGFGAAATARALRDGLDAGAAWGWLQSTPAAHGIYERLGFTTLERWPCWNAPNHSMQSAQRPWIGKCVNRAS